MVTLKDIAQEAGVSVPLVSAVVNGKADRMRISAATKGLVERTIEKMGYDQANSRGARQMVARKHGIRIPNNVIAVCSIGEVIHSDLLGEASSRVNPYDREILAGIDAAVYKYGLDLLVCRHPGNSLPRLIKNGEVDGVIPIGCSRSVLEQFVALQIPTVQLVIPYENSHLVGIDNERGILDTVKHLVDLGHRGIAYLGYQIEDHPDKASGRVVANQRFGSFCEAMRGYGLIPEFTDVTFGPTPMEVVASAVNRLWQKSGGKITALVCYNDLLAMGAIRGLQQRGLRVPEDVSVTGFDDISREIAFEPEISSVYYDRFQLGYRGVEVLFQTRDAWFANENVELTHEILPIKFVERASTASPRAKRESS